MRKIIIGSSISLITIFIGTLIFLATFGIKTNQFNNLIGEKISEINSKIKLDLNEVNFKLKLPNFEFEVVTTEPTISINEKKIDLENINFDFKIFEYVKNENPISQISIETKENNIDQLINFINEYDYNIARNLILKQINKGKIKIFSEIIFDQNSTNNLKYFINGYVNKAEIKLFNNLKANNINFDFQIKQNAISLNQIELLFDKIFISSDELNINKTSNQLEINGEFKNNELVGEVIRFIEKDKKRPICSPQN